MVQNNLEKPKRATSTVGHTDHNNDWRSYMRAPNMPGLDAIATDRPGDGVSPQAMLASAFVLAKIGDPTGAREQLRHMTSATKLILLLGRTLRTCCLLMPMSGYTRTAL